MKSFFCSRFLLQLGCTIACFSLVGCPDSPGSIPKKEKDRAAIKEADQKRTAENGRADAEKDIAAGILRVWTQPLPSPPWANSFHQMAKDNGIELKATRKPADVKTDYFKAYNERMDKEITKKFGPRFIQKLEQKAQKGVKSKRP